MQTNDTKRKADCLQNALDCFRGKTEENYDFEVEKGSLRKCENGIEVTLTGNLIVPKR